MGSPRSSIVTRVEAMRLVTVAVVWLTLPRALLYFDLPAWTVAAILFATSIASPLINAPLITLLSTRAPEAVRGKVLTATATIVTIAGPLGLVLAGYALQGWGVHTVLLVSTLCQLPFAFVFAGLAARDTGAHAAAPTAEPA